MGAARPRLLSLDVLRGLAVAGMIVVTSPGDWNQTYGPLQHAAWHGWTLTDLIFPTFLFAVGLALGLSFPRVMQTRADRTAAWRTVARRVVLLIALGLALELIYTGLRTLGAPGVGPGDLAHLRLPGVLQRIGLCYGLVAALILATGGDADSRSVRIRPGVVLAAVVAILMAYAALMLTVPVPGFGPGQLDPEGNLAAWIDRAVFTPDHLWPLGSVEWGGPVVYDPEGLLSTLPACVNVCAGVLTAWVWTREGARSLLKVALVGAGLMLLGGTLDPLCPINKRLWTSSFALLSSGASALIFVAVTLLLRGEVAHRLSWPLRVLGANAIVAFVLSILFGYVRDVPIIAAESGPVGFRAWSNALTVGLIGDPKLASLAVALAALVAIVLIVWPLHRRGWHLRL
ncbi:hypothetical protein BZG35_13305 [Brevundimonas sp. LM2]|uniref:acyltransferase family protein n=1 Tax=Brevundimonas sp. LM2 TaxID=1938605 RepID=UPI00098403A6|nr:heparan-alpha-glucosaminide N-acetyltransferase domain-containing protein [Brevundimonas sp. LM2]AQR62513.1 hypothetical protein BZG35_13305 [Brevundimonas sp. LM2]